MGEAGLGSGETHGAVPQEESGLWDQPELVHIPGLLPLTLTLGGKSLLVILTLYRVHEDHVKYFKASKSLKMWID